MIQLKEKNDLACTAAFSFEKDFKEVAYHGEPDGSVSIVVGLGEKGRLDRIRVKEAAAVAAKTMKTLGQNAYGLNVRLLAETKESYLGDVTEGLFLAEPGQEVTMFGSRVPFSAAAKTEEAGIVAESIRIARELVNCPGNQLRPLAFAKRLEELFSDTEVETEQLVFGQLRAMEMNGLASVGGSSEYPPCLFIMRYRGKKNSREITGLVGKGVTCDTGGYCLKPASSMAGIKGDMAGGAAVAGAILALAKNRARVNVTGIIPMCENRISPASLLPGDVIRSYSGKTIEVLNTDAEGRLILADAVSYAVSKEKVSTVLDIATLTGAVVNMLGFTVGGMMSDSKELKARFQKAAETSGERYWELPFYEEHEKMLESKVADLKNMGEDCCGTITAGLFIRRFAEGTPWIHLDIAGTAWVNAPIHAFQDKGATGAGVSTLYYYCKGEES